MGSRSAALPLQSEDRGSQRQISGPQSLSGRSKPGQSGVRPMGHDEAGGHAEVRARIEPKRPVYLAKADRQRRSDLSQNGYGYGYIYIYIQHMIYNI